MVAFNPLGPPIMGDREETQRGFAPLHAPMGGLGEAKPVLVGWTLLNLGVSPDADCTCLVIPAEAGIQRGE
jgi:hypothetical protein